MTNLDEQLAALFATRERVRQRNGRTEFLTDDGLWVGTEEEATVRREQVVRQRRTRPSGESVRKVVVLYAKYLPETIEFWVGGDRTTPLKVIEIPRFARSFPSTSVIENVEQYSERFQIGSSGNVPIIERELIPVDLYQTSYYSTIAGTASVEGTATWVSDPRPELNQRVTAIASGTPESVSDDLNATDITPVIANSPGVPFPLQATDTFNDTNPPPEPSLLYSEEVSLLRTPSGTELTSVLGVLLWNAPGDPFGPKWAEATVTFNASMSATLIENMFFRAYLSVSATGTWVTLAWDLRGNGYQNIKIFRVNTIDAQEIPQPSAQDWRRSIANTTPITGSIATYPTSDDVCVDAYRFNSTANLSGNLLFQPQGGWGQLVEGQAWIERIKTQDVNLAIDTIRLTRGEACQPQLVNTQPIPVKALNIASGDVVQWIAVSAINE